MIKSPATKKRIAWGRIVKRMKEHGCYTIADLENFPMLLKRSFLDAPHIHTKKQTESKIQIVTEVRLNAETFKLACPAD